MSLTPKQKRFIIDVDAKVNNMLAGGCKEEIILFLMWDQIPEIKQIIDCGEDKELELYLDVYKGFYLYAKLLERLSNGGPYLG